MRPVRARRTGNNSPLDVPGAVGMAHLGLLPQDPIRREIFFCLVCGASSNAAGEEPSEQRSPQDDQEDSFANAVPSWFRTVHVQEEERAHSADNRRE
jgi:hypothetical protein